MLAPDRSGNFTEEAFLKAGVTIAADHEPPHQEQVPIEAYSEDADVELYLEPSGTQAKAPDIHTATKKHFTPVALDDVTISADPPWLIRGIIPARGLVCAVGPPKSGKSFLITDMLSSVARNVPYAGRETIGGPVVYLTGEGVNGFRRRLVALRRHHGIEGHGTPFYMIENVPDLGSEQTDLPQLIGELDAFMAIHCPEGPRAIALDTLARCMGEADENSARDMGRFVNRCSLIERHFGCVVVVVHHVGKDPTRGGRGSNSLNGAADVTLLVEKTDDCSKVLISESKDGPEGQGWTFRLVPVEVGDPNGAGETTTCIVELLTEPQDAAKAAPRGKIAPRLQKALEALHNVLASDDAVTLSGNRRAAHRDRWAAECNTRGLIDLAGKAVSARTLMNTFRRDLVAANVIGCEGDLSWLIR